MIFYYFSVWNNLNLLLKSTKRWSTIELEFEIEVGLQGYSLKWPSSTMKIRNDNKILVGDCLKRFWALIEHLWWCLWDCKRLWDDINLLWDPAGVQNYCNLSRRVTRLQWLSSNEDRLTSLSPTRLKRTTTVVQNGTKISKTPGLDKLKS